MIGQITFKPIRRATVETQVVKFAKPPKFTISVQAPKVGFPESPPTINLKWDQPGGIPFEIAKEVLESSKSFGDRASGTFYGIKTEFAIAEAATTSKILRPVGTFTNQFIRRDLTSPSGPTVSAPSLAGQQRLFDESLVLMRRRFGAEFSRMSTFRRLNLPN